MAKTYTEIKAEIDAIKTASTSSKVTAANLGTQLQDALDYAKETDDKADYINGAVLSMKKRELKYLNEVQIDASGKLVVPTSSASNYYVYFVSVRKGQKVRYTATNGTAKVLRYGFLEDYPSIGDVVDDVVSETSTSVDVTIKAPIDGYFIVYHFKTYFVDQVIRTDEVNLSNTPIVYDLDLVGGGFNSYGRTEMLYTSNNTDYFKTMRSKKFISAFEVIGIETIGENESVTLHCFNDEFVYLGTAQVGNVRSTYVNCSWVGIQIVSTTPISTLRKVSVTTLSKNDEFSFASRPYSNLSYWAFSFDVSVPISDGKRHYDTAYINMPPNYDNLGNNKVPLVIFCHGSGGFNPSTAGHNYGSYIHSLCNCGYAVADCSGFTDYYLFSEDADAQFAVNQSNSRFTDVKLHSYISLYKHLVECYNIKDDGCYIMGKSNGGLAVSALCAMSAIPIKACAMLACSLSIPMSMRYTKGTTINYWAKALGMTHTFTTNGTKYLYEVETEDDRNALVSEIDKYKLIDGYMMLNDVNKSSVVDKLVHKNYVDLTESWSDVEALTSVAHKMQNVPTKIWHAPDDTDVPINLSKTFLQMITNYGGHCVLREMPSGCGAHHSVDNAENAPHTNYTTKYGGVMDIPTAYAEVIDWFNMW